MVIVGALVPIWYQCISNISRWHMLEEISTVILRCSPKLLQQFHLSEWQPYHHLKCCSLSISYLLIHQVTLTHRGRVTHICIGKLTIIGSDNGLLPGRRQAIIWTNAGILLFGPLGSNFSEILIENDTFSFKKMHLKLSSAKWRPFCLGLNVLR